MMLEVFDWLDISFTPSFSLAFHFQCIAQLIGIADIAFMQYIKILVIGSVLRLKFKDYLNVK